MVTHFYFFCVDADFGPFFLKFATYFPYNAKLCINGHEWAKRQAAQAGIEFTPLDNAFAACADPAGLQKICDRLTPATLDSLLRKWLRLLPHPFTRTDRAGGYRYDISILQAEFSLTQTLDRPLSGRVLFEEVIRKNPDLGRPDKAGLIFDRRIRTRGQHSTSGRFRTRVLTTGSPRACTWTTSALGSSSTTSKDRRSEPRRPSRTPATSRSDAGWVTCPLWRQSAFRPTDATAGVDGDVLSFRYYDNGCGRRAAPSRPSSPAHQGLAGRADGGPAAIRREDVARYRRTILAGYRRERGHRREGGAWTSQRSTVTCAPYAVR